MGKQQLKLLLCAVAAVAALLVSLFVAAWFRMDIAGNEIAIDLRSGSLCDLNGVCVSFPLDKLKGFYPIMGSAAFFSGIPVLILVIVQCTSRMVTGVANRAASKFGYILATSAAITGFTAGYLFAPETQSFEDFAVVTVTRTWAPLLFVAGNLVAMFAMYLSAVRWADNDVGEYKPLKLDKAEKGRLPVTPLSVNRVPTPPQGGSYATPSAQPLSARERVPDSLPLEGGRDDDSRRSRTPSSQVRTVDAAGPRHTPSQQFRQIDDTGRSKPPSQPPAVARTASPSGLRTRTASQQPLSVVEVDARSKSPSQAPLDPRSKSPSQGPLVSRTTSPSGLAVDPIERSRTSSSGPIDLASRLNAAAPHGVREPLGMSDGPLAISIRRPLPQPEPVPADQIPVDPAAGLTIRKRAPSVGDHAPAVTNMPTVALDGIEGLAELKDELSKPHSTVSRVTTKPFEGTREPAPVFPAYIQNKINYAITVAEISPNGITGTREDGTTRQVAWDKIVGVIARRLPPDKPFESATIVDVVSSAGATLRVVPWTKIRGGLPLDDHAVERARGFVNLVAAQALGAKLDATTKLFADSHGQAAQLPTVATLGTHDARLA